MESFIDRLSKDVARTTSRREALKVTGYAVLGTLFASVGWKKTWAQSTTLNCSSCQTCDLDAGQCGLPCDDPFTAPFICDLASRDTAVHDLSTFLTAQGFQQAVSPDVTIAVESGALIRWALAIGYQLSSNSAETALLSYVKEASGAQYVFATVESNGVIQYGLFFDESGKLTKVLPPYQADTTVSAQQAQTAPQRKDSFVTTSRPNPDITAQALTFACRFACNTVCNLIANYFLCRAITILVCDFTGPLAPICPLILGQVCRYQSADNCLSGCSSICGCNFADQPCGGGCCGSCQTCDPTTQKCVPIICPPGYTCAGGACVCDLCGGTCCLPGQSCVNNTCSGCVDGESPCFGECCGAGDYCCGHTGTSVACCPVGTQCCAQGEFASCCPPGYTCCHAVYPEAYCCGPGFSCCTYPDGTANCCP